MPDLTPFREVVSKLAIMIVCGLIAWLCVVGVLRFFEHRKPADEPPLPITKVWLDERADGSITVFSETLDRRRIVFATNITLTGINAEQRIHDRAYQFLIFSRSLGASNIGLQFTINARTNIYPAH